MLPANLFQIPAFLKAKSPELLQEQMLDNNVLNGKEFKYFDIQHVKGIWYAWYLKDFSQAAVTNVSQKVAK